MTQADVTAFLPYDYVAELFEDSYEIIAGKNRQLGRH